MKPDLRELAERLYGTDPYRKPNIYLDEYERLFGYLRDEPINLLELGVHRGISMQIWREYFPAATVVGIDSSEKPEGFPTDNRFHFVRGGQQDRAVHALALEAAGGPFDIIIDDASHVGCFTALTFSMLFGKALKPGGIYIIEDICTAFSPSGWDAESYDPAKIGEFGKGIVRNPFLRRVSYRFLDYGLLRNFLVGDPQPKLFPSHQNGMIGLVKQIIDHAMAPTAGPEKTPYAIEKVIVLTNIAIVQKAVISDRPGTS